MVLAWVVGTASAGRQPFTEILDTELVPARVAELQTSVTDTIGTPDGADDETGTIWGAAFGVAPPLEVVLDTEIAYAHADGTTAFTWYRGQVRWRLAKAGPPPEPGHLVPLVHLSVERIVADQLLELRGDTVVATDLAKGLHASGMVGGTVVSTGEEALLQGGIGLTGQATASLRLGGEVFAELGLVPDLEGPAVSAGPDASYTLGPFWITAGALVGMGPTRGYDVAAKVAWGIEL